MTHSDQPFRRSPHGADDGEPGAPVPPSTPAGDNIRSAPIILDPEFHQSVWKPWQSSMERPQGSGEGSGTTGTSHSGRQRPMHWVLAGVAVALIMVVVLPALMSRSSVAAPQPLIQDMPTRPTMSWKADGGQQCQESIDAHHLIMYDTHRVWSLDLRTGRPTWSVMLPTAIDDITCLPGANLIAVSENAPSDVAFAITLLDGATGETVDVLPSTATMQVIPLGTNIGLLGPDNVLTMVTKDQLDSPRWTRELPGLAVGRDPVYAHPISDGIVQLFYDGADTESEYDTTVVSVQDGSLPAWSTTSSGEFSSWEFIDDVVVRLDVDDDPYTTTAVDQAGNELWTSDYTYPSTHDDRLLLSVLDEDEGSSRMFEVDTHTGLPMNDDVYEGELHVVQQTRDGSIVALGVDDVIFLDEHLKPRATIDAEQFRFLLEGTQQLFLGDVTDTTDLGQKWRVTAISPADFSVVWTLDLEENQDIAQMGEHLIVTDHGANTVHGLWSSRD